VGHFCPPGSGSAIWMRIRVQQLNPQPWPPGLHLNPGLPGFYE
jgi:hypothetical protein